MQLVLDTNIVLDLLVFADPQAQPVSQGLRAGTLDWLATPAMREELARVLAYPKLAPRVTHHRGSADAVLADFDRHVTLVEPAAKAPLTCGDPDDQKFIDLAISVGAHTLVTRDKALLKLARKALERHGVRVCRPETWSAELAG